jgi:hypothetical protein
MEVLSSISGARCIDATAATRADLGDHRAAVIDIGVNAA